jgi:hypothetical protein
MNNTNAIFLAIGIAAVLAIVVAPAMIESASAAIRDACQKNGRTSDGDCEGNTAKNGKEDVRLNPANKAPPGQND